MFQMTDLSSNPYFDHCIMRTFSSVCLMVRWSACHVVDECFVVDFVFNVLLLLVTAEI